MITKENLIDAGAEKLSSILIDLYESHPDFQKHLETSFAGLEEDQKTYLSHQKRENLS